MKMRELDKVLNDNEKILWEGTPRFWPFFFSGVIFALFGLVFLVVGGFVLGIAIATHNYFLLLFPHFWIGAAIVFGVPMYKILVYKKTYYAITDKRVIIQKGVVGRDFDMVDYDQMSNAEVNVGVFDVLFGHGSGSILISTPGTFVQGKYGPVAHPYIVANIPNPYDVFKLFKKTSFNVKTDMDFPNKYRPGDNPGYNTKLKQ